MNFVRIELLISSIYIFTSEIGVEIIMNLNCEMSKYHYEFVYFESKHVEMELKFDWKSVAQIDLF